MTTQGCFQSEHTSAKAGYFGMFAIDSLVNIRSVTEKQISITIYPNPANNYVSIELHIQEEYIDAELIIVNQTGRIEKKELCENRNLVELDISDLTSGVYFVKIKDRTGNNGFSLKKLIVL